jgi:Pentapeptide repeats (8 copies)
MVEQMGKQAAGEKQGRKPWTLREFGGKTFWDWLQLLIVPVVLSLITVVFAWQQDNRQNQIENKRAQEAQKIEGQRAEAERELAEKRAQDEALQAYLNEMTQLILDRKLLKAEPGDLADTRPQERRGDPVHTLAQARTSTLILRLDAEHNESVTRFLSSSGLAGYRSTSPRLLSGIALPDATLRGADLRYANLFLANLIGANLTSADVREAYLRGAYLRGADLEGADLGGTILEGTHLSGANLAEAYALTDEQIDAAWDLDAATMPNGQKYEDWLNSTGTADTTGTTTGTTGAPRGTTTSGTTGASDGGIDAGTTTTGTSTTGGATNGGDTTSTNDRVMGNGKSGGSP